MFWVILVDLGLTLLNAFNLDIQGVLRTDDLRLRVRKGLKPNILWL